MKDEVKIKGETIEKLVKEVENYKSKFEQSLNIVKQYQKKMISMASELQVRASWEKGEGFPSRHAFANSNPPLRFASLCFARRPRTTRTTRTIITPLPSLSRTT